MMYTYKARAKLKLCIHSILLDVTLSLPQQQKFGIAD